MSNEIKDLTPVTKTEFVIAMREVLSSHQEYETRLDDIERSIGEEPVENALTDHDERINKLESAVEEIEDDNRIEELEESAQDHEKEIETLQDELNDLERRVDDLEDADNVLQGDFDETMDEVQAVDINHDMRIKKLETLLSMGFFARLIWVLTGKM